MGKQPYTEARKRNNKKWDDAHLKRGGYAIPIELSEKFDNYCKNKNISKNGLICEMIRERLERDGYM